jgi:two-component system phosphate regulon sensor histidine kinase PhoR
MAAVAACAASHRFRMSCRDLARQLRASPASPPATLASVSRSVTSSEPAVATLVSALNEVLTSADRAAAEAAMKARELEIRLKVATAERQHAEAILYSISDAVLVTGPFDDLVLANESAARTFDFDLARANRSPVDTVLRDPRMVQLIREMRQSHAARGRRVVEHQVQTATGPRTFKVTLSTVADSGEVSSSTGSPQASSPRARSGHVTADGAGGAGVVAVLHDVTREKEISDMKNDFVSMVSHELRTPLASIKAYIEMLIDGEAVDEKTTGEFYDVIQNEANRLGRLIDNILNISRIESGLVKADKRPQSLTVIVKEALEVMAPQLAQKGIRLIEDLTPVYYRTEGDRDMLYQAALNLLSNSVKYTPSGGTVTVRTEVDEAAGKIMTRIIDTGVGIPPQDLPFVFEKFYRAEANSGMARGTGLGLSLVKQIVETIHQGQLFVESQVGKGSTFGFELKLCK